MSCFAIVPTIPTSFYSGRIVGLIVPLTNLQTPRLSIIVDKSCLIQPESDPSVLGDHYDAFRDEAICHLAPRGTMIQPDPSNHELKVKRGGGARSLTGLREYRGLLGRYLA